MIRLARSAVLAVAVAAAAATAVPASALAASRATHPGITECGTFSGPHWSYKGAGGTTYISYIQHGGSCAVALAWAPRLVTKKSHGAGYAITGGPKGFICSNSPLHFGVCVQSRNGHPVPSGKSFAWAGKPK